MLLKMAWLFPLLFICFLGLTGANQEWVEHLTLHDPSFPADLQAMYHTDVPLAVSVGNEHLNDVSNSVISAESWVRTYVLAHYPAAKITTIVVGHTLLCNRDRERQMGLVLPSLKNIHHSLTRWDLGGEIKVSASFSSDCLNPSSATYTHDLSDKYIKPVLDFLLNSNSTYSLNPPSNFLPSFPEDTLSLVSSHTESMKNLGFFNLNKINVLISGQKDTKPISRKLSLMDFVAVEPFPARPAPLLAPAHSPKGSSAPAYAPKPENRFPPTASPPTFSHANAPELAPVGGGPASPPPFSHNLPPCQPSNTGAPTAAATAKRGAAWCVAKPSVPEEKLQEAMDYACGVGGADCKAIKQHGSCYSPDTILAHASYAFNSYYQKNKGNGATCGFGGTAMLINADPSYQHCRFIMA